MKSQGINGGGLRHADISRQNDETFRAYCKHAKDTVSVIENADEDKQADFALATTLRCLSQMFTVNLREPIQAAKVLRLAEEHRKEADRLNDVAKREAAKRAKDTRRCEERCQAHRKEA